MVDGGSFGGLQGSPLVLFMLYHPGRYILPLPAEWTAKASELLIWSPLKALLEKGIGRILCAFHVPDRNEWHKQAHACCLHGASTRGVSRHRGNCGWAVMRKDFRDWDCQENVSTDRWELWGKKEKEVFRRANGL